jgi:hypothetical protein
MLVALGVRAVLRAARAPTGPSVPHAHGHEVHAHPTDAPHVHVAGRSFATRPMLVGMMHGLAGSGALTALLLAELPSAGARLAAIVWFGLGSVAGMALLSGLVGVPLARFARSERASRTVLGAAGALSAVVGVVWGLRLLEHEQAPMGVGDVDPAVHDVDPDGAFVR